MKNSESILSETKDEFGNLSIYTEMYNTNKVDLSILIQGSLYIHKFVLKDPIFDFTKYIKKSNINAQFNQFMGLKESGKIDRIELVENIRYVKALTSLFLEV